MIVYLLYAPLWYSSAAYVASRIQQALESAPIPVRAFVLDLNGVSDIDYTGARVHGDLAIDLRHRGVSISIARASHLVHHDLKHSGLLDSIGAERLFTTVEDAVAAL